MMRNSRGGPLKLLSTLRGQGMLIGARGIAVHYQVDLFRRGSMTLASGEIEGRLVTIRGRDGAASLRLEDGSVVAVTLRDVGADLAAFDVDEAGAALCHDLASGRATPATAATAPAS
jgi:hypothetical protein